MGFRKLTLSYDDFQDEKNGLVPYLASAVMMLIRKDDMAAVQQLMNNIAKVSEQLLDLNDEIVDKKDEYDQLQNRIAALNADLAKKEEAQAALKEEMKKLIGDADEEYSDTMEPAEAKDISELMPGLAEDYDPLSELDLALGSLDGDDALADLTVDKVMTNQQVPEALRKAGIVFGDDIDRLAAKDEEVDLADDEDIYADFDLNVEDVDGGYAPVPGLSLAAPAPHQWHGGDGDVADDVYGGYDDLGYDDDDLGNGDDEYGDFGSDDDVDGGEGFSDGYGDDLEPDDDLGDDGRDDDFLDDFVDEDRPSSIDGMFPDAGPGDTQRKDPADDDMPSGFVDLDLFN